MKDNPIIENQPDHPAPAAGGTAPQMPVDARTMSKTDFEAAKAALLRRSASVQINRWIELSVQRILAGKP